VNSIDLANKSTWPLLVNGPSGGQRFYPGRDPVPHGIVVMMTTELDGDRGRVYADTYQYTETCERLIFQERE
jgi:hypothetical protein